MRISCWRKTRPRARSFVPYLRILSDWKINNLIVCYFLTIHSKIKEFKSMHCLYQNDLDKIICYVYRKIETSQHPKDPSL